MLQTDVNGVFGDVVSPKACEMQQQKQQQKQQQQQQILIFKIDSARLSIISTV
jgi:hypothetical protein